MSKTYRALALFSGGLDSLISVLWMQKTGVEVIPIFFKTPFFTEERAVQTATANGLKIEVIDISEQHLQMMKNPRYGFGKNFNPCIDCHGLMFNLAGQLLSKYHADFLISGEVLSQRPMSQRRDAMNAVSKLSGFKDLLIRPLSQKLLDDTLPIREGWINKKDLLSFSGRSRKPQLALAKEIGVIEFPSPAGGCRLTDKNFTIRLKDLMKYNQFNLAEINLLKYGRHFRLNEKTKLIIGRDDTDNDNIEKHKSDFLILFNEENPGPLGLLCVKEAREQDIKLAAGFIAYYNHKTTDSETISYGYSFPLDKTVTVNKAEAQKVKDLMIMEQT